MFEFNHLLITTIPKYHKLSGFEKFKAENNKYSLMFHTDKMSLPAFGILYHHGSAQMLEMWPNPPSEEVLTSARMGGLLNDFPKLFAIFTDISYASTFSDLITVIGAGLPKKFYAYGREFYGDSWKQIKGNALPSELFKIQQLKQTLTATAPPNQEIDLF